MKRPLAALALAWILGTVWARADPQLVFPLLLLGLPLLFLAGRAQSDRSFREAGFWIVLLAVLFLFGFLRTREFGNEHRIRLQQLETVARSNPVVLTGKVFGPPEKKGDYWWLPLSKVSVPSNRGAARIDGIVDLWVNSPTPPRLRHGDLLDATGNVRAYSQEIGRRQDGIANWHEARGAVGSMFLSELDAQVSVREGRLSLVDRTLRERDRWKEAFREWARRSLSPERVGLLAAMTVGDRSGLDANLRAALTRSGLLHLTAISGLHVTATILTLPWLLKLLGIRRWGRAMVALGFALLLLFVVGNRPSVLRAVIMGCCLLLGILLDRSRDSLNFLGGACLLNLILSPLDLFSPGFQFSYLVVASLLLWGPMVGGVLIGVEHLLSKQPFLPPTSRAYLGLVWGIGWFAAAVWTSLIAVVAASPISLYHFHQVAWGALVGNLIAIPLAVALTTVGMASAFGGWMVPVFSELSARFLDLIAGLLADWIRWMDRTNWGFYRVSGFHPLQALIPISILLLARQEQKWLGAVRMSRRAICLLLLFVLALLPLAPGEKVFRVAFLDVGQGDSILLEFPHGEKILVDGGPPRPVSPGGVSPLGALLLSRGIGRLDGVFITHPEADHYGGFQKLLDEIPIETFYCSGDVNPSSEFAVFAEALAARDIPVERVLHGDRLAGVRDATVTVLSPFAEDLVHGLGDKNERSVVLLIETRGLKVLLPGDIGEPQERKLLVEGLLPEVDLLKVPHHGSRYSTTEDFLRAVRPRAAVIQCGVNPHGHPAPEVVERLTGAGIPLFVTLFDGGVTAIWNGKKLLIQTGE